MPACAPTSGHLKHAAQLYEQALGLAQDEDGRAYPIAGKALVGLGEILREWNDFDQATEVLRTGIELISLLGEVGAIVDTFRWLSSSRPLAALPRPAITCKWRRKSPDVLTPRELDDRMVAACAARLDLALGNLENARLWAESWEVFQHLDPPDKTASPAGVMADLLQLERTVLAA